MDNLTQYCEKVDWYHFTWGQLGHMYEKSLKICILLTKFPEISSGEHNNEYMHKILLQEYSIA